MKNTSLFRRNCFNLEKKKYLFSKKDNNIAEKSWKWHRFFLKIENQSSIFKKMLFTKAMEPM